MRVTFSFSQSYFIGFDTTKAKIRIDATIFQFFFGHCETTTKGNLSETSGFLLGANDKASSGFNLDLQAIFYDKIGIETGWDVIRAASPDERKITKQLQDHVPNYEVTFPKNDPDGASNMIRGNNDNGFFKIGLVGLVPCKKMYLLPYMDYLHSKDFSYPYMMSIFNDYSNNTSFTREFKFIGSSCSGLKTGIAWRGYLNGDHKHLHIYFQVKFEYFYLQTSGYTYYLDTDANKNETTSAPEHFTQKLNSFSLGITLMGGDMHW